MAITYFGNQTSATSNSTGAYAWRLVAGYTCPGSGAQDISTLEIEVAALGVGNLRAAIYEIDGTFITQWDAEKDPAGIGWLAVTDFVDQGGTPHSPQLTGGTNYQLVVTGDNSVEVGVNVVTTGLVKLVTTDYTGGFPASLTGGSDHAREYTIRCGVEPAAAGGIVVLRRRRM